jgi:hypothetical protein
MEIINREKSNGIRLNENERYYDFIFPGIGPSNYISATKGILTKGLILPTGEMTACLLSEIYNSDKGDLKREVIGLMRSNKIWVPNKNLWVPKELGYKGTEGVYVVYDKEGEGLSKHISESDIRGFQQSLDNSVEIGGVVFSKDNRVRFAPKETYKIGEQSINEFENNGINIANYGLNGSKKLGDISRMSSEIGSVYGVGHITKPNLRVALLFDSINGGINSSGAGFGQRNDGYLFGYLPNSLS